MGQRVRAQNNKNQIVLSESISRIERRVLLILEGSGVSQDAVLDRVRPELAQVDQSPKTNLLVDQQRERIITDFLT